MCWRREAEGGEIEERGMRCDKTKNMGHNEVGGCDEGKS